MGRRRGGQHAPIVADHDRARASGADVDAQNRNANPLTLVLKGEAYPPCRAKTSAVLERVLPWPSYVINWRNYPVEFALQLFQNGKGTF